MDFDMDVVCMYAKAASPEPQYEYEQMGFDFDLFPPPLQQQQEGEGARGEFEEFRDLSEMHATAAAEREYAQPTAGVDGGAADAESTFVPLEQQHWNERTLKVFDILRERLKYKDEITFAEISHGITRRTAATCFLEVLQLHSWGQIKASQSDLEKGDIYIKLVS